MTAGPCPSPSLVEYTKEVLLEIWRNRPDLADSCMRSIVDKSQPANPLTFHAAAEVCEIYLLNVWWSSDPSERHEAKYAKTCLSSMSFLLSAVDHWIAQVPPYTLHTTPYTLHTTQYTLHTTQYTKNTTPWTKYAKAFSLSLGKIGIHSLAKSPNSSSDTKQFFPCLRGLLLGLTLRRGLNWRLARQPWKRYRLNLIPS